MNGKMMKRMLIVICTILALALPACTAWATAAEEPVIYLNGVPVEKVVLNLSEGNQFQFTSNQPVVWKSSKTYRATIDEAGLLTVKSASDLIISATAANGEKATCEIEMVRLATGIAITGPTELAAGKRGTLKATVLPSNASEKKVSWSSSDESVVSVNSSGRITAAKVSGVKTAVITASATDGSGVCAQHTVTVMPAARSVQIYADGQAADEICLDVVGKPSAKLSASVLPADASQKVTWKSSSASRVKVDENGLITALKPGSATITATAQDGSGKKATIKVRVVRMVTGIEIDGPDSILAGRSGELEAKVSPKNATEQDVVWESSDPSVLTVNKYGAIEAQSVGGLRTVVVTARAQDGSGVYAQHTVTVTPRIDSMKLTAGGQSLGETVTMDIAHPTLDLDALIEPMEACQSVRWKSSSTRRATVDENGVVTALGTGTVTITASAMDGSSVKQTVKIRIVRAVKSIEISGDTIIAGGEKGELSAKVLPRNATEDDVKWESSNEDILSVNKYGDMRAADVSSRQQVTVYAKATDGSGVVGSVQVTVLPAAKSVEVYSGNQPVDTVGIDLAGSRKLQLSAKVGPEDALQSVKWTTSNKKRATVDANGLVTGLKAGKVTITATATDGSGARKKITVNVGVMVRNIAISGPNEVWSGNKIELNARILPGNATDDEVIWSSENSAVAKVSKKGVVTGGVVDVPTQVKIYAEAKDGAGAKSEHIVTVVPVARSISIGRADAGMAGSLILSENGGTAQLTATVYPAAATQQVRWRSSNESVVTVSGDGKVTARRAGRTTIVAESLDGSEVDAVLWVGVGDLTAIPYYFEVDRANQVVRVYERGADNSYSKLIKRMICSTGRSISPGLSNGLYSMSGGRMVWMDGVAIYATRIKDCYLFHSVIYHEHDMGALDASAYNKLGSKASGGCIRLLAGDAKWIYDNVPRGCFVSMMAGVRDVKEYGAVTLPPLKSGNWDPTNPHPENPDFDPTYTSDVK